MRRPRFARLQTQVTLWVMVCVFLSGFALMALYAGSTRDALIDETRRGTSATLKQVIRNLEYYLDDMAALANLSRKQSAVVRLLVNDAPMKTNHSLYYANTQDVRAVLTDLGMLRPEITSILVAGENGALADTSFNLYATSQQSAERMQWYHGAMASGGRSVFLPPHLEWDAMGNARYVISLTRPIAISQHTAPLGAVCINLNTDVLERICKEAEIGKDGYVFIVDQKGNYIYHPTPAYLHGAADTAIAPLRPDDELVTRVLAGEESFTLDGALVLSSAIESADYHVVATLDYAEIVKDANRIQVILICLGAAIAVVVAILIALLLSHRVFRPLNALRKLMARVQDGDFGVRADDAARDEIGELAGGFNAMIRNNLSLMEANVQIEKAKRKAELAALQSQITPHFLYNTLDAIVWMAGYKPEVAAAMASALAKLFRLMLSGGEDVVALAQEFEHVHQYLIIQKMRYNSKFSYDTKMDAACAQVRVPKLILQPLVENAIYHGIKPSKKLCMIKVRAFFDGGDIVLAVMDDGVGMSDQAAQRVLHAAPTAERPFGGIGIRNIDERIRMYFPGEYGLTFLGVEGLGTAALIRLPARGVVR